jgi:hypothetical protein
MSITKKDLDGWLARVSRGDAARFALSLENDFVSWAESAGNNCMPLATYQASPQQAVGVVVGEADPTLYNRAQRQSAHVATAIATFLYDNGQNALDDGNVPEFVTNFGAALIAFLQSSTTGIRIPLTANGNVYVNPATGSDSTGNGTSGSPWATVTHAYNVVASTYDLRGLYTMTINVAAASAFVATQTLSGQVTGATGPAAVIVSFGSGCTISATNSSAIFASNSAQFTLTTPTGTAVVLSATGTSGTEGTGVSASGNGTSVAIGVGVNFGACAVAGMSPSNGAIIYCLNSYTISGGGEQHVYAAEAGQVLYNQMNPITVTTSGTPAFSTAFAFVTVLGIAQFTGATFSGSGATGPRYSVTGNGVINTDGGAASFLPGSTSGSTATGGQYL